MRIKNYHVTPFILAILTKTIIQTPNQTWLFHVYPNYCKKKYISQIQKKLFVLLNIRMMNLSLDKLRLMAKS